MFLYFPKKAQNIILKKKHTFDLELRLITSINTLHLRYGCWKMIQIFFFKLDVVTDKVIF